MRERKHTFRSDRREAGGGAGAAASAALVLLVSLLLAGAPLQAAEQQETVTFSGSSLTVGNLVGSVRVVGGTGSLFVVTVAIAGADARPGLIELRRSDSAAGARLDLQFPEGESRYVYPRYSGRTTLHSHDRDRDRGESWLGQLLSHLTKPRIVVTGAGSGLELWADVTIAAPLGGTVSIEHGVGELTADSVTGDLDFDVAAGGVIVRTVRGNVRVETGSGSVEARAVTGSLSIDTGSGAVRLDQVDGARVTVDTGSGRVDAEAVVATSFEVDSGSGSVLVTDSDLGRARIETGSGGVEVSLRALGAGPFEVDTGSGGIRFELPASASVEVSADTGSGGISLDGEERARVLSKERDSMRFVLGGGGTAVRLDTGSGSIRVRTG